MGVKTGISWCDHTWSAWEGCAKVSPGCSHCYAESLSLRWQKDIWGYTRDGSRKALQLRSDHYWQLPLAWDRRAQQQGVRRRVFNSMNDWADEAADPALLERWWDLIRKTQQLDWLLLTKRPERIPVLLPEDWGDGYRNVWLGTSVENQAYANSRLPHLAQAPARVRFISIEPMLGAINLSDTGSLASIHWVIVGGESGPGARLLKPEWVDQVKYECVQAKIPFFFKQTGTLLAKRLGLNHRKGEERSEWPAKWQVQQFPQGSSAPEQKQLLFAS